MNKPSLFDTLPPDPRKDAAPLAGGAGVPCPDCRPHANSVRLSLQPPARHNAPPGTSDVAASRIAGHTAALRDRVRAFIASRGPEGATDDEGEAALGIKPQTY